MYAESTSVEANCQPCDSEFNFLSLLYFEMRFLHCVFKIFFLATAVSQDTACKFCYFDDRTFTYYEADQFCAGRNSGLAVLDTAPLRQTIRPILPFGIGFYIGLSFLRNNTWLWLDGAVDNRGRRK